MLNLARRRADLHIRQKDDKAARGSVTLERQWNRMKSRCTLFAFSETLHIRRHPRDDLGKLPY